MPDKIRPDTLALHRVAYGQDGYFTARQARAWGFSAQLLDHHTRSGRYERARRGLYRLRGYPGSSREQVRATWLATGDRAVVSHESALELHELSDVLPNAVHLLVARRSRGMRPPPGAALHTTIRPLDKDEVTSVEGIPTTTPERSILDAAAAGTPPDQVVIAVRQTTERGVTTPRRLRTRAEARGRRVAALIDGALEPGPP